MTRRDLIQHLNLNSCVLFREGENHSWWRNPINNKLSSIPRDAHISDVLANKLCLDLKIPKP